jgi:hypothetical protein
LPAGRPRREHLCPMPLTRMLTFAALVAAIYAAHALS